MLGIPAVCIRFGHGQDVSLREPYACFRQFLEFCVAWEHPDYLLSVVDYFVGAFQIVEYAVECLVLDLSSAHWLNPKPMETSLRDPLFSEHAIVRSCPESSPTGKSK